MAFSDDFNDNNINSSLWTPQSTNGVPTDVVKEQNQQLEIFPNAVDPTTASGLFAVDFQSPAVGDYHEVLVKIPAVLPTVVGIAAGIRLGPAYTNPPTNYASLIINNYTAKISAYLPGTGWLDIGIFDTPDTFYNLKIALISGGVEYYVNDLLLYSHNTPIANDYYVSLFADFIGTNQASYAVFDDYVGFQAITAIPRVDWGLTGVGLIGTWNDYGDIADKEEYILILLTFGVLSLISQHGQGLEASISEDGKGVQASISQTMGLFAIISNNAKGVENTISQSGQGVEGKL